MRYAIYNVMITINIDVVLIRLMGVGNMASVGLALILMEAITINWTIVTFTFYSIQERL